MIRVGETQIPPPPRRLEQGVDYLLPHQATLIFQQASMTGFRRGGAVRRQIFPLAARFEDVQNAIEDVPFVRPWPSSPRSFQQQGLKIVSLCIRHIGAVGLPRGPRHPV
jgi:hypothetical protein